MSDSACCHQSTKSQLGQRMISKITFYKPAYLTRC
jgi:hypothetical protein